MGGWGVTFIVVTVLLYFLSLAVKSRGRKYSAPARNGQIVLVVFIGLFLTALQAIPFYLGIDYPFNWAAWLVTLWWVGSLIYVFVRFLIGIDAKPAPTGWAYAGSVARSTLIYGGEIVLFLFAAGVLA